MSVNHLLSTKNLLEKKLQKMALVFASGREVGSRVQGSGEGERLAFPMFPFVPFEFGATGKYTRNFYFLKNPAITPCHLLYFSF